MPETSSFNPFDDGSCGLIDCWTWILIGLAGGAMAGFVVRKYLVGRRQFTASSRNQSLPSRVPERMRAEIVQD